MFYLHSSLCCETAGQRPDSTNVDNLYIQQSITCLLDVDAYALTITLRLEPGASLETFIDDQSWCTLAPSAFPPTYGSTGLDPLVIHRQITSALAHIHARNLVHDDVKPENVIWDSSRKRAVLIDFGATVNFNDTDGQRLAPPKDDDGTYFFTPSGTPSYAPPEFLDRRKSSTGKGDVWALGVTMLFVWGYVRLPDGEWLLPRVVNWDNEEPASGCREREEMQEWLRKVRNLRDGSAGDDRPGLRAMLVDDPAERIGSADLERLLSGCA